MNIKNCFILAAGHGTRMGEIGKYLPKPLWPIFEKSLLEAQICFAQEFGCENFYMNAHHLSEEIEKFVNRKQLNITILKEKKLLGSGGAFYNLKSLVKDELVLYLNADVLYLFDQDFYSKLVEKSLNHRVVLAGLNVKSNYNQLVLENNYLKDINLEPKDLNYVTYAGLGIINMSLIEERKGRHNFFNTIADYNNNNIPVVIPNKEFEYWDFGTKEQYINSLFEITSQNDYLVKDFFIRNNILESSYLSKNSYKTKNQSLNFGHSVKYRFPNGSIILDDQIKDGEKIGLYYKKIIDVYSD